MGYSIYGATAEMDQLQSSSSCCWISSRMQSMQAFSRLSIKYWFICSHALHLFIQLLICLFMKTLHRCSSTIYQVAHQLLVGLPAMRSADMMVLRRCAMTRVVRPAMRPSSAACTSLSDSLSSALVASSSNSTCNTQGSYIGRQSC